MHLMYMIRIVPSQEYDFCNRMSCRDAFLGHIVRQPVLELMLVKQLPMYWMPLFPFFIVLHTYSQFGAGSHLHFNAWQMMKNKLLCYIQNNH